MYACNSFFTSPASGFRCVRLEWRLADIYAEQAANEHGRETRRLLAQLLHRGLLADANYHDDEQEHDEDGHGPGDEDEDRKHQLPAPSAMAWSMSICEARVRDESWGRTLAQ